ncbi:NAD(P)-dependent oxidoreductase [Actinacidiphila sp. bgisy145]|uniref:NAD(P)-dependent oxidoreductase n=1 Tax=Actinacidiphila sp. bgisy145 TaxID=3413792 RepID=UPI003EB984BA
MLKVGLIGLGRMGRPLCTRLARAGHPVTAFDARPERKADAERSGARWQDSAKAAAAGADVLVTVLPGPADVAAAVDDAVLRALGAGGIWLDMSSSTPEAAAALRDLARRHGVDTLEAPIGGSPRDAAAGRARLFVGAEEATLTRVRPLLEALTAPGLLTRVGGPGTGYVAKLLVNSLWFGQAVATAEALLLGSRAGIDPALMREVLLAGPAAGAFTRDHLPALFAGDYLPSYELDRIHDQLAAVTALAGELGTPHTVAEAVRAVHQRALARYGPVNGELLGVALLEEQAGLTLRPGRPDRPGSTDGPSGPSGPDGRQERR